MISSHTTFLGFRNPSSIFVGIESTYGGGPSAFVKNNEHRASGNPVKQNKIAGSTDSRQLVTEKLKSFPFIYFLGGVGWGEVGYSVLLQLHFPLTI